jgi:DNA-binding NarL/FixJ family response regulator
MGSDDPIDFMIADKNPLVRRGLISLCQEDGRFTCGGDFATGQEFLDAFLNGETKIGVTGWLLPDMQATELLKAVRATGLDKRVVVYTGAGHAEIPKRVMALGGFGYCSKSDPPEFLLDTMVDVHHGRISFPYVDVRSLYSDPFAHLTKREMELLTALARGWTNEQIARRYGITANTVKFHLKNLYEKLEVNNRAMAVALYVKREGEAP